MGTQAHAQLPLLEWTRQWGGNVNEHNGGMDILPNGDIITLVTAWPQCTFDPSGSSPVVTSLGGSDLLMVRFDTLGAVVWTRTMGGPGYDYGNAIDINTYGDVFITGFIAGTADMDPSAQSLLVSSDGEFDYDIVVGKYDASGAVQWAFGLGGGGPGDDSGNGVAATVDGGVLVTGAFFEPMDCDPGPAVAMIYSHGEADIFVAKYSDVGAFEWAFALGGPETDEAFSIDTDANGNAYITGWHRLDADFDPGPDDYVLDYSCSRAFLASYDPSGAFRWAFQFGAGCQSRGICVRTGKPDGVFVTGSFAFTTDMDPGPGVHELNAATGSVFLAKYDVFGNYQWARNYGSGVTYDPGYTIDLDRHGNVYTAGHFQGSMDGDTSADTCMLSALGYTDIFVSAFDPTGSWLWSGSVAGAQGYERVPSIRIQRDAIYLSGQFNYSADMDLGTDSAFCDLDPYRDIFLCRYVQAAPTSVSEMATVSNDLLLFPNPTAANILVQAPAELLGGRIRVMDALGRQYYDQVLSAERITVELDALPVGLYIVACSKGLWSSSVRLVVER